MEEPKNLVESLSVEPGKMEGLSLYARCAADMLYYALLLEKLVAKCCKFKSLNQPHKRVRRRTSLTEKTAERRTILMFGFLCLNVTLGDV